jgi:trk system potassium uptake protein TrkA
MGGKTTDKNWPQYVVIVGCGRLGSLLAGLLSQAGSSVVIIDRDEASFALLPPEFSGFRITGDAVEMEILQRAKVHSAGCLLAVTGEDNVNLMVAQVAHELFKVPRVMARVFDPRREAIYHAFGIETVSPTKLSADFFLATLEKGGEEKS